ncbi:MAG: alpha/beta fold hydrolase [Parachlamydiaceae bacterium]|nr:alpha/beta fold hydrolase [Parachlamydiaceae bacterium]
MTKIWTLPGFLGLPSDWDFLKCEHIHAIDLSLFSLKSLRGWAHQFNQFVLKENEEPSFLMGYSLGGRLALHALIDSPKQWKGAIIVSAHPGLKTFDEKEKRLIRDQMWGERFLKKDWQSLMIEWNGQEVFSSDGFHFPRMEKEYQRQQIAQMLVNLSLGAQEDITEEILRLPMPIMWITGQDDKRFSQIASELKFSCEKSKWLNVENAGHRVPWVQPEVFLKHIREFTNN